MGKFREAFHNTSARLWLIGCALLAAGSIAYAASSALSSLSAASAMSDTDLLYVVQSAGSGGLKGTLTQLRTYLFGKVSGDCTATAGGAVTCTKTNGTAFGALATVTPGTGVATALGINVGSAGAPVVNGGALGAPSSGNGANLTGVPISTGIGGLGAGVATALAIAPNATGGVVGVTAGCQAVVPTDQSGGGLTFTSTNVQFCQYGNIVFYYGSIVYPTTADTHNAAISTPVAVPNQTYANIEAPVAGTGGNTVIKPVPSGSTAIFQLLNTSAAQINSTFSGKTISFGFSYPAQ